jgi:hypothetical protein
MIIIGATIVMRVNHSEMTGKFMDEVVMSQARKHGVFISCFAILEGISD